jgi:CheY-like chemotaxis protein
MIVTPASGYLRGVRLTRYSPLVSAAQHSTTFDRGALFRNDCLGVIDLTMAHGLAGKRVLVIEDEHLFAEYLADAMTAEGAEVIEPVGTVNAALDIIANTRLDGVTLDLKLAREMTFEVADALAAHNIPFVFLTGYGAAQVPDRYAHVRRVEKPVTPQAVCRALEAAIAAHSKD